MICYPPSGYIIFSLRKLISYLIIGIFEEKKCKRNKCKQSAKSGHYQHFNKMDILDNDKWEC